MIQHIKIIYACTLVCLPIVNSFAQDALHSADEPRPIPLTRPQLKQFIEQVKVRTPRIPLPDLSTEDRDVLGNRADIYETRLKYHFLNQSPPNSNRGRSAAGRRTQDTNMTLDYAFKVELFWIVSRTNNCHYCLGHQESKLLGAGLDEERIAALDCDWSMFTPSERAAFAFARKYTYEPHLLGDQDFEQLGKFYSDLQILEMCISMSWNNAINRWKEAVGVPQNADEGGYSRMLRDAAEGDPTVDPNLPSGSYLTPTPIAFRDKLTRVAPLSIDPLSGRTSVENVAIRPSLESREHVMRQLATVAERQPRLLLVDEATTRQRMNVGDAPVPNWLRLLANFPQEGARRAAAFTAALAGPELSPRLVGQLRWIVARQDRAWYSTAHAWKLLREQGITADEIFELDGDWNQFTPREQALFVLATNLAASPVVLTDEQVARALEHAGPAQVVQAIELVTQLAAFDRLTEAANLPLEDVDE